MGKISRKERKLAKKTMRQLDTARHRSKLEEQNPQVSYKRKIIHTKMPWPLEVIQMGRGDIILLLIIIIILIIVATIIGIWYLFNWLMGVLA